MKKDIREDVRKDNPKHGLVNLSSGHRTRVSKFIWPAASAAGQINLLTRVRGPGDNVTNPCSGSYIYNGVYAFY